MGISCILLFSHLNHVIKIMKLIIFCLLVSVTASFATNAHSQVAKVNIDVNNVQTKDVIQQIESQTDYLFVYSQAIDLSQKVSMKVSETPVAEVLSKIFEKTNVIYAMEGNNILLLKKEEVAKNNDKKATASAGKAPSPVLSGTPGVVDRAQQSNNRVLTGKIIDENREPVIGANVFIRGTTTGVVSDIDGNFSINVTPETVIVVSFIGYETQEIVVGNQNNITVTLFEEVNLLQEVVAVGYGTQKKVNLAGAVESVSAKTLESRNTNNIGVALQGIVPNLTITPGSGQADNTPGFNIRGTTSINGGDPLILVDGIPTSAADFVRMNSMDIDNISVLKDASSAAIYGARAAFGVILVTTKKGKGEKLTVQFNNNYNIQTPTRMPKVVWQDPYIHASYKKEMGKPWYDLYTDDELAYAMQRRDDPSLPGTIVRALDPSKYTYLETTDWYNEVFDKTASSRQHNLSVSGASSKVSYYLGAEYYQEKGLLKINKDVYDRFNVRSRVEYKPTDWLTVGNNTALTYYTYDKPMNFYSWMFGQVVRTNPLMPIYNPDGSYTVDGAQIIGTLTEGGESKKKNSSIYTQFTADFELIKNMWNVKADFTAKLLNSKLNEWDSDRTIPYKEGPNGPDLYLGWANFANRTADNTAYTMFNLYTDFRKTLGLHSFSVVGGFSQEYETYEKLYARRLDLITDTYPTPELAVGEMTINESKHAWVVRSAFYRLNYILAEKYIFETNGRYDGTSRFRNDDRFGFFPSVSAAWIVSNEQFFSGINSWFSHLKLRGSYGSLGNQGVDPNKPDYYPYIASMAAAKISSLINGDKPMGVSPPGLVSNALTWEKVYTLNGGVDANFLNNRLSVSADIYRRDTKDMLTLGKTLPNVLGTSEPKVNAADLKTEGWELSFLWRDNLSLAKSPLNYSARFILSDSRSYITKFDNPTGYLGGSFGDYYVGREIGELWGLETLGFFKDQADIDSSPDQWSVTSYPGDRPMEPGDLKYKDQNGDGKVDRGSYTVDDPGDFKVIGNTQSRYNFGLDLNASWNGFDVRVFFQGVGKKSFYPKGYKANGIFVAPWGNVLETTLDHWTPENPNAYFPRLKSYLDWDVGDLSIPQTRYLQNAAYLRMKNMTIGYSLPKTLLRPVKLENVRFYFSGENLFEITKLYDNYDPEGLSGNEHPFLRTVSIGLNITL